VFYCFTVLLFYCFTVLLFYCFTVLLFYCFTVFCFLPKPFGKSLFTLFTPCHGTAWYPCIKYSYPTLVLHVLDKSILCSILFVLFYFTWRLQGKPLIFPLLLLLVSDSIQFGQFSAKFHLVQSTPKFSLVQFNLVACPVHSTWILSFIFEIPLVNHPHSARVCSLACPNSWPAQIPCALFIAHFGPIKLRSSFWPLDLILLWCYTPRHPYWFSEELVASASALPCFDALWLPPISCFSFYLRSVENVKGPCAPRWLLITNLWPTFPIRSDAGVNLAKEGKARQGKARHGMAWHGMLLPQHIRLALF
jgi:hypothetical protein